MRGRIADERRQLAAVLDGLTPEEWESPSLCGGWHPWKPPGGGDTGALTHDVIHGLDITRPLGIDRDIPAERLRAVLDSVAGPKSRRFFGIDLEGVELRAVDLDWTWGSGAPLTGRGVDIALLLTGRPTPPGALVGDAATAVLRSSTP